MAAFVMARAAAAFDPGRDGVAQRCPGEEDCERFCTAAGSDQAAKAANACTGCPLLPTKISRAGGISEAEVEWILSSIERVRVERDSGGGLDLHAISWSTWQLVQLWDQVEERYSSARQAEMHALMFALFEAGRA